MNPWDGIADLHLHTVASDGTDTISERVDQARDRDLPAIAITDHDRIPPELEEPLTVRQGVEVVTGAEVRADVGGTKVELLAYFVDPKATELKSVLERARAHRRERNRQLVAALNETLDLDLEYNHLAESVPGGLGRPHLANVLVDRGIVPDVSSAFTEYLAEEGSCFVPMDRVPASEVLTAIHEAGGVASLAHPGRIRTANLSTIVRELVGGGLEAIETAYPYGAETDFTRYDAEVLVDSFDVLSTGGSDCHGRDSGKFRIGTVGIHEKTYRLLADRAEAAGSGAFR